MLRTFLSAGALALLAAAASADTQFSISEMLVNPPGTDNGQEGIEIRGPANASLAGYKLIIVEGDGTNAGNVDVVLDLGAFSTGSNGLFLWRDAASTVLPAPDGATSINVADFNPDIENGSNTYILGFGTAPAVNTDLDTDAGGGNGTLDVPLTGFTVVDAVTILENDGANNFGYADDLGFANAMLGPFNGPTPNAHTPDAIVRIYNADGPCSWAEGDVLGSAGGPYTYQIGAEASGFTEQGIASAVVTLGSANPAGADADADGITDVCDGCPHDANKGAPGSCGCGVAEGCSLGIDVDSIVLSNGGSQVLSLHGGAGFAGFGYILLGAATGTAPGLQVTPTVHLDLNVDFYFNLLASSPNTFIVPSLGNLDGSGEATATLTLPALPGLIGSPITLNHAYLVFQPVGGAIKFASNTTPLTVNP